VRETFGERPEQVRAAEVRAAAVRLTARYRLDHAITDASDALGPPPEEREERREWDRAQREIERSGRRLGRDVGMGRSAGIDIGF
jgi:hypothetical protein